MQPTILAVDTTKNSLPKETSVVIIGAGIVGLMTALTLAERGISVVILEKGTLAGEQSSRNLGWIRKTNRHISDLPMAITADYLWKNMAQRVGADVGYRQAGIMFAAQSDQELQAHEKWLDSVQKLNLDSKLLSAKEIAQLIPNSQTAWKGALYTPSDGRAEPTLVSSLVAKAALKLGVKIIENCAVRTLVLTAGKISSIATEQGEIKCQQVLVASGLWSRKLLKKYHINLPTLPLICSVLKTAPMTGPTDIAFGASNFSFRKHIDGGYIITQRGALDAPLTLDHLFLGTQYLQQLRHQRDYLRISLGRYFFEDFRLIKHWNGTSTSPFEQIRTMDPQANMDLNNEALANLSEAWPIFKNIKIENTWAGVIDVTPDSIPIIDTIQKIPGLYIATGFSGHGFGTSPTAGHLAADLITNRHPIIDPAPYRLNRFK